ncbi:DNA-3-methyladenine glycosylase [Cumulibacter soli]|uniref:DNA-3-methyladenine glycosylase n=1 Tax=Cumulibacter soli TaxID=2546344 RepID=UPI0010679584|nr:DNA-3-methyladenine glycosylase [Cumulibacter soli]
MRSLPREFFRRDPTVVAPELIGALISSRAGGETVTARITETEAYRQDDPASHTYRGRTPRNEVMFGEPGHLYVYLSHGIHHCVNAVSHIDGQAGGVLIRAARVLDGEVIAARRRANARDADHLARGPGLLARALGLTMTQAGADLCDADSDVQLFSDGVRLQISAGPRVGVRLAPDVPWRFWASADRSVSTYRRSPRAEPVDGRAARSIDS